MHIAICDDNIADRKQLERLLSRESDTRITTTGVLYIDSYGHETTLLRAPMVYDLFFLDLREGTKNGLDIAEKLREFGVTAPIVMCSGSIDYTVIPHELPDILHLKKPISPSVLTPLITHVLAQKSKLRSTVEIRDEENTYYLFPEDIIAAKESLRVVTIFLADGTVRRMLGSIYDLAASLESYPYFALTLKHSIFNLHYIKEMSSSELVLEQNIQIPLVFLEHTKIKKWLKKQQEM